MVKAVSPSYNQYRPRFCVVPTFPLPPFYGGKKMVPSEYESRNGLLKQPSGKNYLSIGPNFSFFAINSSWVSLRSGSFIIASLGHAATHCGSS